MGQAVADRRPSDSPLLDKLNAPAQWRQRLFNLWYSGIGAVNERRNSPECLVINLSAIVTGTHQASDPLEDTLRRWLTPAPEVADLGRFDNRLAMGLCMFAVKKNVDRQDAIDIHVIVHGHGPVAGAWTVEEAEANLGGSSGPVFDGCSVRPPVAQF